MGIDASYAIKPQALEKMSSDLSALGVTFGSYESDAFITCEGRVLTQVVEVLKNKHAFDAFVDLCGVDLYPNTPRFQVVIHLYSTAHKHRIRLKVSVPQNGLTVPSITSFWKGANWQERECYDMYGIVFEGHPNLERILSAPGTEVFAQRKDYALIGERPKIRPEHKA